MKVLDKTLAVLQLPGLLALVIGPWLVWLVVIFISIPLAFVVWPALVWVGVEAFIAPLRAFEGGAEKRPTLGNLRRLLAGSFVGIVLAAIVLHPGTDRDHRPQLFWLLGLVPTVLAFVVEALSLRRK